MTSKNSPNWNRIYEIAATQEGLFTTVQAADAGYSPQLLAKYLQNERIVRLRRGVYRLVHFPPGDNEDIVGIWLWSMQEGIFSHETALALHQLSDALPSKIYITLPETWRKRRIRVPDEVVVHHENIPSVFRTWMGAVPVTTAARTINDCAASNVAPELVGQAIDEGARRGLFTPNMVREAADYEHRFGDGGA